MAAHGVVIRGRVELREGVLTFRDCMALAARAALVAA
jgi:hypothetical protein